MSLLKTVAVGVTPEGSEALLPKNHSKYGVGTLEGREPRRVTEQISEYISPAVLEPEVEIVIDRLNSTKAQILLCMGLTPCFATHLCLHIWSGQHQQRLVAHSENVLFPLECIYDRDEPNHKIVLHS